jgi:DNA replication and repair protein RecF
MVIQTITLTNFRNYESKKEDLANLNLLIGPNGVGKTNFLESIYLLSNAKSNRTRIDHEMIKWGQDFARVEAKIDQNNHSTTVAIFLSVNSDEPAKVAMVGKTKKKIAQFIGIVKAVLFSPENLDLIKGSPSTRRRFFDRMLCQIDHHYTYELLQLQKILAERNKLLSMIKIRKADPDQLDFWDQQLVEKGAKIISARQEAVNFFNQIISSLYQKLSAKSSDQLLLVYRPSVEAEKLAEQLVASREQEIHFEATLYGPHRDDFSALLNQKNSAAFCSRGEIRSIVFSLKMAEVEYLTQKTGQRPILLLDDIFSELDSLRRAYLAELIIAQQTIITTTDLDHLSPEARSKGKIIKLG